MQSRRVWRLSVACMIFLLLCACVPLLGQKRSRADIKITSLKVEAVKTPDFKASKDTPKDHWARFVVKYDVKRAGTRDKWIDEMDIVWKILVTDANGKAQLFSKVVTYEDIEEGADHKACVYLKPKFLRRFMDTSRVSTAAFSVYAEIQIDGQKIDSFIEGKPRHSSVGKWYREEGSRERSDRYLMSRSQTPFGVLDYDSYETEKASE